MGQLKLGMDVLQSEAGPANGGDGVTSGTGMGMIVVVMTIAAMAVRAFT